jgi:hypothetical protein
MAPHYKQSLSLCYSTQYKQSYTSFLLEFFQLIQNIRCMTLGLQCNALPQLPESYDMISGRTKNSSKEQKFFEKALGSYKITRPKNHMIDTVLRINIVLLQFECNENTKIFVSYVIQLKW